MRTLISGDLAIVGETDLELYVVYKFPRDYPENYVVRRFFILRGEEFAETKPYALVGCLAEARASIPLNCVRLDRYPADDPAIEEVWL